MDGMIFRRLYDVPRGVLLTITMFIMLGGARLETVILAIFAFSPAIFNTSISIGVSGFDMLVNIASGITGFIYLFIAYGLYYRTTWARLLTIVISVFYAIYGIAIVLVNMPAFLIGLFSSEIRTSATTNIMATSLLVTQIIYKASMAITMIYVICYLRQPHIKEWFITPVENESEKAPDHDIQRS